MRLVYGARDLHPTTPPAITTPVMQSAAGNLFRPLHFYRAEVGHATLKSIAQGDLHSTLRSHVAECLLDRHTSYRRTRAERRARHA